MRVTDEIKKCVVFLGLPSEKDGFISTKYRATGFFVGVPLNDDGTPFGSGFPYLVTAKHVALRLAGMEFVVRANTKDGKSVLIKSSSAYPPKWYFHPTDDNADVAVLPWGTSRDSDVVDYRVLATGTFLKSEYLRPQGIGIGHEICIVGLFKFHEGQSKNHPMLRTGNIAMIPDEKISTNDGAMDAYLIEARSTGGLSGSPVFVAHLPISKSLILLGLIHGHWELPEAKINDVTQDKDNKETSINTGIAIVTPAQKILDILYGPELSQLREDRLKNEEKPISPTPD